MRLARLMGGEAAPAEKRGGAGFPRRPKLFALMARYRGRKRTRRPAEFTDDSMRPRA